MSQSPVRTTKLPVQYGSHSLLCCEEPTCNEVFDVELVDGVPFCPQHHPTILPVAEQ